MSRARLTRRADPSGGHPPWPLATVLVLGLLLSADPSRSVAQDPGRGSSPAHPGGLPARGRIVFQSQVEGRWQSNMFQSMREAQAFLQRVKHWPGSSHHRIIDARTGAMLIMANRRRR